MTASRSPDGPVQTKAVNGADDFYIRKYKAARLGGAAAAAIIYIFVLASWMSRDPAADLVMAVPGRDGAPDTLQTAFDGVRIGEFHTEFGVTPAPMSTPTPGEWPRFRGTGFDNVIAEGPRLRDTWDGEAEVLWSVELGEGHAAPAVSEGRVYLLDYDEENRADALRCFSLPEGTELWRTWYRIDLKRNHGVSRTVPAVGGGYVVTVGPACHVMCVEADTGKYRWGIDLPSQYGTEVPFWYTGQCPVIDGDTVVLAPGGDSLLIGVDLESGRLRWSAANPDEWKMSHSSIMKGRILGVRTYVYRAVGGIVGVSAEPGSQGRVLWTCDDPATKVIAPSPVILDDGEEGYIFFSAGYGAGSMLLHITEEEGTYSAHTVYSGSPGQVLSCEQQTPVYYRGALFGVMPDDGGALRGQMVRFDPLARLHEPTGGSTGGGGEFLWSSGKESRFGLGPFCVADGKLFILDDRGRLTVADAEAGTWAPLGSVQVLRGVDAWGPMAIAGTRLLVRDSRTLVCLEVGQ